ncbi:MAG TPA: DUF2716 domain-containing protein [Aldersonia sp.]
MWTADDLTDCPDGTWIDAALDGHSRVRSLVPPEYEAYARVLHPATLGIDTDAERPIRWSTIADANARVMHPLVEWDRIVPSNANGQPGLWDAGPAFRAPVAVRRALAHILAHHTDTPQRCYYAIWEGNTILDDLRSHPTALTVESLNHFVVADTVAHAEGDLRSVVASYWWPADRAWFVADHIDLQASYVGGSRTCIAEVLECRDLETFPLEPDDDVTSNADTVNVPFTVDTRAHRGWRVLTADDREHWWALFEDRFHFRPGYADDGYDGIAEPSPSITFDLTKAANWAPRDAINAEAMRCFVAHFPDGLVVLDWQHDGYLLDPVAHTAERHTPWPVEVYPDGDYYAFLARDLAAGTFGHPWRQTLCVFGTPLVDTLGTTLPTWLPVLRVDGRPVR